MLDSGVARANSSTHAKFAILFFALFSLIACGDDQTFPVESTGDPTADASVDRADDTSPNPSPDAGMDTDQAFGADSNFADASDAADSDEGEDFEPAPIPVPDAGDDTQPDTSDDESDRNDDDGWGDWDDGPQDAGPSPDPEPEPEPEPTPEPDAGSPTSPDTGWSQDTGGPEDAGGYDDDDDDDDWSWPGWGNRDAGGSSNRDAGGSSSQDAGQSWTDTGSSPDTGGSWTDTGSSPDTGGSPTDSGGGGTVTACADNDGVCGTDCTILEDNNCVLDCRDASTWPNSWVTIEDQVLQLTNAERAAGATCGTSFYSPKPSLTSDADLREAARCHSYDMAIQDFFSHTSLNGDSLSDRVNATGYGWRAIGENIAVGYSSPSSVMGGWMNSPGHCQNIMSSNTELGVGYVDDIGNGRPQWTQDFGTPR